MNAYYAFARKDGKTYHKVIYTHSLKSARELARKEYPVDDGYTNQDAVKRIGPWLTAN